jgi:hypothetical protein
MFHGDRHIAHQPPQFRWQPIERLGDHDFEPLRVDIDHEVIVRLGGKRRGAGGKTHGQRDLRHRRARVAPSMRQWTTACEPGSILLSFCFSLASCVAYLSGLANRPRVRRC